MKIPMKLITDEETEMKSVLFPPQSFLKGNLGTVKVIKAPSRKEKGDDENDENDKIKEENAIRKQQRQQFAATNIVQFHFENKIGYAITDVNKIGRRITHLLLDINPTLDRAQQPSLKKEAIDSIAVSFKTTANGLLAILHESEDKCLCIEARPTRTCMPNSELFIEVSEGRAMVNVLNKADLPYDPDWAHYRGETEEKHKTELADMDSREIAFNEACNILEQESMSEEGIKYFRELFAWNCANPFEKDEQIFVVLGRYYTGKSSYICKLFARAYGGRLINFLQKPARMRFSELIERFPLANIRDDIPNKLKEADFQHAKHSATAEVTNQEFKYQDISPIVNYSMEIWICNPDVFRKPPPSYRRLVGILFQSESESDVWDNFLSKMRDLNLLREKNKEYNPITLRFARRRLQREHYRIMSEGGYEFLRTKEQGWAINSCPRFVKLMDELDVGGMHKSAIVERAKDILVALKKWDEDPALQVELVTAYVSDEKNRWLPKNKSAIRVAPHTIATILEGLGCSMSPISFSKCLKAYVAKHNMIHEKPNTQRRSYFIPITDKNTESYVKVIDDILEYLKQFLRSTVINESGIEKELNITDWEEISGKHIIQK